MFNCRPLIEKIAQLVKVELETALKSQKRALCWLDTRLNQTDWSDSTRKHNSDSVLFAFTRLFWPAEVERLRELDCLTQHENNLDLPS